MRRCSTGVQVQTKSPPASRSDSRCRPTCGCCGSSSAPPPASKPRRRSCVSGGGRRWSPNSPVEQMCTNKTVQKRCWRNSFQTLLKVWTSSGFGDVTTREKNTFHPVPERHERNQATRWGKYKGWIYLCLVCNLKKSNILRIKLTSKRRHFMNKYRILQSMSTWSQVKVALSTKHKKILFLPVCWFEWWTLKDTHVHTAIQLRETEFIQSVQSSHRTLL